MTAERLERSDQVGLWPSQVPSATNESPTHELKRRRTISLRAARYPASAHQGLSEDESDPVSHEVAAETKERILSSRLRHLGGQAICMSASGVGRLIQATLGSFGAVGVRPENRSGLAV